MITISRQAGSGGLAVAEQLARFLEARRPGLPCPWTVFDRNLVQRALEEHKLPQSLAPFMTETQESYIDDLMEELLGLHPASSTLVHQTTETILHLAEIGHVILVGRGANVITAKMDWAFHVRLVGSMEPRLERLMERGNLARRAALALLRKEDRGRARYLKKYFDARIDDPLLYHLVVNTDWLSAEEIARLVGETVLQRYYAGAQA